jgi:hypothetical protein
MTAIVLGNGRSRLMLDTNWLMALAPVYGCNALYRTHAPQVLVATDQHIAQEIQDSGYARLHRFYTRRPGPQSGALTVPRQYFGYSSGPIAVALAAVDRYDPIYLIGFDMGPDVHGRFNNVYAGTDYYKPVASEPTFTGNWVRQLIRIMADFPSTKFIRVQGAETADIAEFAPVRNLQHITQQQFRTSINNPKEP